MTALAHAEARGYRDMARVLAATEPRSRRGPEAHPSVAFGAGRMAGTRNPDILSEEDWIQPVSVLRTAPE